MILIFIGVAAVIMYCLIHKRITRTIKWKNRYERRNKIINQSWRRVYEIENLRKNRSSCIAKGVTIFKGGSNLMTTDEFADALHKRKEKQL